MQLKEEKTFYNLKLILKSFKLSSKESNADFQV